MKLILFFLLYSAAVFSQIEKKTNTIKVIPKKNELIKTVDAKKNLSKLIDIQNKSKIIDSKKKNILKESEIKLNDTVVTITKKTIEEASEYEKMLSYDVAFRLLNSCNTSKLKKFTDVELSKNLLKKITLSYISAICVNNNEEYGKFISLELKEILTNENIQTNIYRYLIEYERKLQKKEIRIYIDKMGLVSVIKTLKWKNKFELKKKPKRRPKKKLIVDSLTIIDESFIIRN